MQQEKFFRKETVCRGWRQGMVKACSGNAPFSPQWGKNNNAIHIVIGLYWSVWETWLLLVVDTKFTYYCSVRAYQHHVRCMHCIVRIFRLFIYSCRKQKGSVSKVNLWLGVIRFYLWANQHCECTKEDQSDSASLSCRHTGGTEKTWQKCHTIQSL